MKAASLIFIGLVLGGCGDDSTVLTGATTPKLELLGARGGTRNSTPILSGCVAVGADPDRTAFVVFDVENYELKPPSSCFGAQRCGAVSVSLVAADGEQTSVRSMLSHVPVKFVELPLGEYEVSVRLVNDFGKDAGTSACSPGPCKSEVIRFATSCSGDSGVAIVADAALDGGRTEFPLDGSPLDSGSTLDGGNQQDGGSTLDAGGPHDAGTDAAPADASDAVTADGGPRRPDAGIDASTPLDSGSTASDAAR